MNVVSPSDAETRTATASSKRPLRLAAIIPTLDQGGAEKQFALLAAGLPRDQFNVHVFVLTRSGPWEDFLRDAKIPVTLIGKRLKFDPLAYWRLRRELRRFRPDLVHTWLFAANTYGRLAAWGAGCQNVIVGERCVDLWKSWHQLAIDRRLAKRTSRFVVNSTGVKEFYQHQGIDPAKIEVIPNGIELPAADDPARLTREQLLDELRLPQDAKLIGAVGRLWPQKRLKDLIWAADLLKCIRDDTHLLIVGDGPQRDQLIRYASQVEILDRVHFLGHRSDAPRLLGLFDILWLGSEYEGLSNVLMEAMAQRVPVICTNISANRDLVQHLENGIIVPVGDRASFAKWTSHLLEHSEQMTSIATHALERIQNEFQVSQMVERHAKVYTQVVQAKT